MLWKEALEIADFYTPSQSSEDTIGSSMFSKDTRSGQKVICGISPPSLGQLAPSASGK